VSIDKDELVDLLWDVAERAQEVVDDSKVRLQFRRTLDAQAKGYGPEWDLAAALDRLRTKVPTRNTDSPPESSADR
jgi:hypothetical protein